MNIRTFTIAILMIASLVSCKKYTSYDDASFKEKTPADWENPAVFEINRENPRAYFIPYSNENIPVRYTPEESELVYSLNGDWSFFLSNSPSERPKWFFKEDFAQENGTISRCLRTGKCWDMIFLFIQM